MSIVLDWQTAWIENNQLAGIRFHSRAPTNLCAFAKNFRGKKLLRKPKLVRLHRIRLQFSIAWFSRSSRRTYSRKENPSSVLIRRESSYSTRDTHTKSGTEVHKTRVKEEEKIQFYSFCVYVRFCSPSSWNKKKKRILQNLVCLFGCTRVYRTFSFYPLKCICR